MVISIKTSAYDFFNQHQTMMMYVNRDQILTAIKDCLLEDAKCDYYKTEVKKARLELQLDMMKMETLRTEFNTYYATDYNLFFSDLNRQSQSFFKSIRASMKIFKGFCRRSMKHPPVKDGEYQAVYAYQRSLLCQRFTSKILFPETFSDSAKQLCNELQFFFAELKGATSLFLDILRIERNIMADESICKKLYEEQYKKLEADISYIINTLEGSNFYYSIKDPINLQIPKPYSFHFHKLNIKEMKTHVLLDVIRKRTQYYITDEERAILGNDITKIEKTKFVISHLDEIVSKCHKGKTKIKRISGLHLAMLITWCESLNHKSFHKWLRKMYQGDLEIPEYSSISKQIVKVNKNNDNYKEFVNHIDALLIRMPNNNTQQTQYIQFANMKRISI